MEREYNMPKAIQNRLYEARYAPSLKMLDGSAEIGEQEGFLMVLQSPIPTPTLRLMVRS